MFIPLVASLGLSRARRPRLGRASPVHPGRESRVVNRRSFDKGNEFIGLCCEFHRTRLLTMRPQKSPVASMGVTNPNSYPC